MPHGTTATFNQYVKYFFPLANQFGKKEAPTSEQCYQPLPFNTGRVLLDCLLPNSTPAEQLPTFHPGDKVWSGEFASIFWLTPRPKETAQNTLHLRAPEVPISVQHGTGAGRGWLLHDFQTKFSLWGRGATALAQSYPLGAVYPFAKPSPSCAWSRPPGQLAFLTRLCTRFQQPPGKSLQQLSVGRLFFF